MPQLDYIIIFPQIFWLFISFTFLYIILTHFFLPKFLKFLKARKLIINENSSETFTAINKFNEKQILLKNLILTENTILNDFIFLNVKSQLDTHLIDEKIAIALINITLYCDIQLLNLIFFYPKLLNLHLDTTNK